jgi:hypothetical protein
MEELYDGIALQVSDHSLYWDDRVSTAQKQLEEIMRQEDEPKFNQENPSVDLNEMYNGMAVQTSDHSRYWDDRVSTAQKQLEEIMRQEDEPKYNQENPSVDINELYNGMAVQTGWDNIHSQNWYDEQEKFDRQWNQREAMAEYYGEPEETPEYHRQTID